MIGPKIAVAMAITGLLAGAYGLLSEAGVLEMILDGALLRQQILQLGRWGPLAIIGLMAVAIVLSPIPSAPIALAAGVTYGHTWGTLYVLIGAEIGALIAFGIARFLGFDALNRRFGNRLSFGLLGSQNTLMAIVFVTRLMPFLSFDLVSYAAGLTPLRLWRFAIATLAGIVPASFLLAHFGDELASADAARMTIAVAAIGGVTLIPLAIKMLWRRRHLCAAKSRDQS